MTHWELYYEVLFMTEALEAGETDHTDSETIGNRYGVSVYLNTI